VRFFWADTVEDYKCLTSSGVHSCVLSLFTAFWLFVQTPASTTELDAQITFSTKPPGSSLLIDGKRIRGRTPITLRLAPGPSIVTFVPPGEGYKRVTASYSWQPHETRRVRINLPMSFGSIRVRTGRAWSKLELDKRPAGIRADAWQRIQAGNHIILAFDGRFGGVARFRVPEEGRVSVNLAWRKFSPDPASFAFIAARKAKIGSAEFANLNAPRSVDLAGFWIGRNEVTVREYADCVRAQNCSPPGRGEACNWSVAGRDDHPVNCVSAVQATEYARWFSAQDEFAYRLPTTFEWETTATAGGGREYPWGAGPPGGRCNVCDRSCAWTWRDSTIDDGWPQTAPAGRLKNCSGPEHVYDLVGNVAEWCSIPGSNNYDLRGGSWASPRTLYDPRSPNLKDSRFTDATTGFRLAASPVDLTEDEKK
jgi:formylglycine-generating enzyme required for sulfatase activity